MNIDQDEVESAFWFGRVEPIARELRINFKKYLQIWSDVFINEMMIRCKAWTEHTVKMKCKPIKQGYKIFALYSEGYTWNFIYWSYVKGLDPLPASQPCYNTK